MPQSPSAVVAEPRFRPKPFRSLLFLDVDDAPGVHEAAPEYFGDLNLDQVVAALTAGREEYRLEPFLHTRLTSVAAIEYRHEVFRDLQDAGLRAHVDRFASAMRRTREQREQAAGLSHRSEREAWLLDAAETYCAAVGRLDADLKPVRLGSSGLRSFRRCLTGIVASAGFDALRHDAELVRAGLDEVCYCLTIRGDRIKVRRFEGQPDHTTEIEQTFERFKRAAARDYRAPFTSPPGMDHVEAQIAELVERLHPEPFAALHDFCERHDDFVEATLATFDREVQFYLAYLDHAERLRRSGLSVALPQVSAGAKEVHASETFDIALATRLVSEGGTVVVNDFRLADPERIFVVTGPNQGGKTTFARTFGQLHHLAALGCPVPGREARLHLCDQLFTHFEREEEISNLSGKLEDDLRRVHGILERATPDSVVVMNESFTSTTVRDALVLGTAVTRRMIELDLLCVYVTFVDELASLGETVVSLVSAVVPEDPATRTFKLERRPADGLAHAAAIAERYGLTAARVRERMAS